MPCVTPTDNVWADGSARGLAYAFGEVESHLDQHSVTYTHRALLLPHGSVRNESYHQNYSANKNVGTARGKSPERGGPVVAVDPPLKLLEIGLRLADGQLFGVATVHPYEVAG